MPRVEFRCEAISSPCSRSGEELGEGMADGSVVRERNFLDAQERRIGPERIERIRQRDRPPSFPPCLRDVDDATVEVIHSVYLTDECGAGRGAAGPTCAS